MGKIYKIINTNNGKFYIGQTKNTVVQRFAQHIDNAHKIYKKYPTEFRKDIINAGENVFNIFKFEIIEECPNDKLNERERYWISITNPIYNFVYKKEYIKNNYVEEICNLYKKGYTITEIRKKYKLEHNEVSQILKNNNIQITRAKPNAYNRRKIYHFDLYGNLINEYNYTAECANTLGYKRDNMRCCALNNSKKGCLYYTCCNEYFSYNKEQPYLYKIINHNTKEKEEILLKTKKALEIEIEKRIGKYTNISQIIRKGRKTFYGYEIIKLNNIKENNNIKIRENKKMKGSKNPRARKISKFSLNGNKIKTYNTIKDACEDNNIKNNSNVISCCKGRQFTAYGYIWKYED